VSAPPRPQDSSYAIPELTRPLRPLWITPASACFPHVAPDASFFPIICVSASRAVDEGIERRTGGFSYVQGSGDDHELWGQVRYYILLDRSIVMMVFFCFLSGEPTDGQNYDTTSQGLTPQLFWRHRAELLSCSREELEAVVAKLVVAARETEGPPPSRDGLLHGASWKAPPTPVRKVGGRVLLCALTDLPRDLPVDVPGTCGPEDDGETAFVVVYASDDAPCHVGQSPLTDARSDDTGSEAASRVLRVHLPSGRCGRHILLHEVLPRTVSFVRSHLGLGRKICVAGGDEGIGVALVLLQLFFDDDGGCLRDGTPKDVTAIGKSSVRTRLEWIIASQPQVNPSRAILKRVNDFLLSPRLQYPGGGNMGRVTSSKYSTERASLIQYDTN
jgi:tRNA A64-2'-O-ribosylphosphate transferase